MKHNYIKTLLALLMIVTVLISSCQKDNGTVDLAAGQATITINMKGIGASPDNSNPGLRASVGTGKSITTPAVQRQIAKFNEQYNVTATLREVSPATAPVLRASANRAETTATGTGEILALGAGTAYTVRVYDGATLVDEKTFIQGEGNAEKFTLAGGKTYRFQAFAYGNASAEEGSADKDPLWWEKEIAITAGSNTVDIVLEHKLTEVTVVFNAGTGREITAINTGTLAPNHNYTFNKETGEVTFGSTTTAAAINFTNQSAGQTWTSDPVMIAVEDTNNGTVELSDVTINGIDGAISSDGWVLKAGVQYILELNLGNKEEQGIDIGGSMWSSGNLTYDPETDEYYFGEAHNAAGDYWFPDRLLPKRLDGTNQGSDATNGGNGDPCALVSSGSWRLPTQAELQDLLNRTASGGVDNPGPESWSPPARYVDHYDGTPSTDLGMFFGVLTHPVTHPGENRDQYLFFPYGGYYPNDNIGATVGREAAYLTSATAGGYITFHLTGVAGDIGYGSGWRAASATEAVQIRCVQN
ncbi:fimbrillin family protein [Sphingobacterium gobiense]|uniref:Fibrobacter succinogenes major paralogous domain-containing protein n=1 Tax=Sphingobacterium gobiense TaxID=1382456 RepID=A0A2S9JLP0_9SPHI|nr:fimbrillin family protein [Sphingobacterium gobiense]PRD54073.1 hypothetical protein C5749_11300 [Sphingobacterium gobiense]